MICVNSPLSRLTTVHFDLLDGLALLAMLFLPLYLRYAALFATMLGTTPLSSGTFIPGVCGKVFNAPLLCFRSVLRRTQPSLSRVESRWLCRVCRAGGREVQLLPFPPLFWAPLRIAGPVGNGCANDHRRAGSWSFGYKRNLAKECCLLLKALVPLTLQRATHSAMAFRASLPRLAGNLDGLLRKSPNDVVFTTGLRTPIARMGKVRRSSLHTNKIKFLS